MLRGTAPRQGNRGALVRMCLGGTAPYQFHPVLLAFHHPVRGGFFF